MRLRSSRSLRSRSAPHSRGAPRARGADPRSVGIKVAAVVGVVLLALTAVVFSNSFATRELVDDGLTTQRAEACLGANDVAFKALGQAVLLAEDRALGVADDQVVALAASEAESSMVDLVASAELLLGLSDSQDLRTTIDNAAAAADEVLTAVDNGSVESAADALNRAKPAFEQLREVVSDLRDAHADALVTAGDVAGTMGNITRFLVAFILPLGAIFAYRFAARRQLRMAEVELDAQLAAEHEIHKAKDEFIASMSHELRTPLTSIYGFSEVLIESGAVDPDVTMDLVEMINSESAELGRMVEDLLVSARAAADALVFSFQDVDMADEIASIVAPFIRGGADIEVEVPRGIVHADPLRARQIARNLVSNAIRHGGPRVFVTGRIDDGRMGIAVADNGPGVPAEMEDRLFSRFIHDGREALAVGSVGLGLAVARELATAMGGNITYRRAGTWTVFEFCLPLAGDQTAAIGRPAAVPAPPPPVGATSDVD